MGVGEFEAEQAKVRVTGKTKTERDADTMYGVIMINIIHVRPALYVMFRRLCYANLLSRESI